VRLVALKRLKGQSGGEEKAAGWLCPVPAPKALKPGIGRGLGSGSKPPEGLSAEAESEPG
jgi:hypothetical protein